MTVTKSMVGTNYSIMKQISVLLMLYSMVGPVLSWMPTPALLTCTRPLSLRSIKAPSRLDQFMSAKNHSIPVLHPPEAPAPLQKKSRRRSWNESFQLLKEYKEEHGDCLVPPTFPDSSLAKWVATQRQRHEKISNKHRKVLEEIGFDWKRHTSWEDMYDKLKEYRRAHGDCLVPAKWEEDPKLADWVGTQRSKRSKLSKDQVAALDEIGFDWNRRETMWMEMYRKLERFKEAHGDCHVSIKRTHDALFTGWVQRQRAMHAKGELRPDRLEMLDRMGFEWLEAAKPANASGTSHAKTSGTGSSIALDDSWLVGYVKLVAFSHEHGHCEIPSDYHEDPFLATWVRQQRDLWKNNTLKQTRKDLLDRIRFSWNPEKTLNEGGAKSDAEQGDKGST